MGEYVKYVKSYFSSTIIEYDLIKDKISSGISTTLVSDHGKTTVKITSVLNPRLVSDYENTIVPIISVLSYICIHRYGSINLAKYLGDIIYLRPY